MFPFQRCFLQIYANKLRLKGKNIVLGVMFQVTLPYAIPVAFWSAFHLAYDQKFSLQIAAPISTTTSDFIISSH